MPSQCNLWDGRTTLSGPTRGDVSQKSRVNQGKTPRTRQRFRLRVVYARTEHLSDYRSWNGMIGRDFAKLIPPAVF